MFTTEEILKLLLLISPILLIQLGMVIYALIDLFRRSRMRGPRWVWALGLILGAVSVPAGVIIAGAYLAWGRHPKDEA
jgi:hypothetical protein